MADGSKIEWTDATWNPVTGCKVLSPGCTNCYAMRLAGTRLKDHPSRTGLTEMTKTGPVWTGETRFNEQWLDQPLRWRRPRMIFVVAHGDLFYEEVPESWIDRVFAAIALCPQHIFQILTKRPERMAGCVERYQRRVISNVWLGFSAEDQRRFEEREDAAKELAQKGWLVWASLEPLLGHIAMGDAVEWLSWVVAGYESGPHHRKRSPDIVRNIRDQCITAGVPFNFKQWGGPTPKSRGRVLDGRVWDEMPRANKP